jgi:ribosomal protein S6
METEEQKSYEVSFLAQSEDGAGVVIKRLNHLGAEILGEENVGLINLAYPIKKHGAAHFGYIQFRAGTETIKLLKDALKFEDGILRHLVVVAQPSIKVAPAVRRPQRGGGGERRALSEQQAGGSLSNEDLETKLREIRESLPEQG